MAVAIRADFLRLHRAWIEQGRPHGGIIVAEQAAVGETTRRLLKLLNRVTLDGMRTGKDRIRRAGAARQCPAKKRLLYLDRLQRLG